MGDDCIFCKIVRNEIPSSNIYTNDKVIAFLDVNPVNKGHVLIVPKDHYETLLDIPDNIVKELLVIAKKIGKSARKALKADGFNIGMNNFPAAGQVVFHAHLHIIPRFENDGLQHWPSKKYEEGEMDQVREKIATFL
jgi:histidine triad (HIT) family protein